MISDTDKNLILDGICPVQKCACPDDCPIIPEKGTAPYCPAYYQTRHPMSPEMRARYEGAKQ